MSDHAQIAPLTRNGYSRTSAVENDILSAMPLTGPELRAAFMRNPEQDGHLSAEALAFFIRREIARGGLREAEALFGILVARCITAFRSMVRGVDEEAREDIQAEVLADLTRLLLATNDSGDFLQCRFWLYLRRRTVTARASWLRNKRSLLLAGDLVPGEDDPAKLEDQATDCDLSPEERAILTDALGRLPPELRELVVLRHYEGWRVGDEPPEQRNGSDPSLSERFKITPRAIRKRLARAVTMLKDERN